MSAGDVFQDIERDFQRNQPVMTKPNIASPRTVGLEQYYEPVDHNNIPTPPIAVDALNRLQPLNRKVVWECAVGEGFLAKSMEFHGAEVYGSDFRRKSVGHKIYGIGGCDIAEAKSWPKQDIDLIVTNPPYGALLRPFMGAVVRFTGQPKCPPIWFLLGQHTMASVWLHKQAGHLLRGYYPFTFGLPYLKNGKWVAGGAFKHAWTLWGTIDGLQTTQNIDCQFLTRDWIYSDVPENPQRG